MARYFKHFWIFFVIVIVVCGVCVPIKIAMSKGDGVTYTRTNHEAPKERVFDYADVLSDGEEEQLRALIAEKEVQCGCDIVLVTINEPELNTEQELMVYADDFYDHNQFGFDKACGDGCLYLDNWGSGYYWFSTCGRCEAKYSSEMIDSLTTGINDELVEDYEGPYGYEYFYDAYEYYVETVYRNMNGHSAALQVDHPLLISLGVALLVAIIYVLVGVSHTKAKITTNDLTYVKAGTHVFH
nr:TPM domain-containing protein [Lachnospiraceae bacterium]